MYRIARVDIVCFDVSSFIDPLCLYCREMFGGEGNIQRIWETAGGTVFYCG